MATPTVKVQSVVLTTLLVCSFVAAVGPLAGTAGATQAVGNSALLTDGPNWYGQEFAIDVTQNAGGEFSAGSGDTVYLLEIDDGTASVNRTARVLTVNSSGYVLVDTENLETDNRQTYALNDNNELNSEAVNFTLEPQELDLEWEEDAIATDTEAVALETVESNRGAGEYNVTISAEGFDYDQLRALFIHPGTDSKEVTARNHLPVERLGFDSDDGDGVEELRSGGYITLNLSTSTNFTDDGEIVANFSNLEANETLPDDGEYEFDIVVTDSNAEDNATVQIGGAQADFEEQLYTRAAGDIAEFTVELDSTDQTWVQFRDTESNFVDVLYLEDDDGDNQVTFYANTRLIGTDHSQLSSISEGDAEVVYYSDGDTVQSYIHHENIPSGSGTEVSNAQFYDAESLDSDNEITFNQYIQQINGNGPASQLDRPLQSTTYELVIGRAGQFAIEDGEPIVDRRLGGTELDLVQPTLRQFDTWVAPEATANSQQSIGELEANLSSGNTVAIGDRIVFRFNNTGIVGALATIDYVQNDNSIDTGLYEGYGVDVFYELTVNQDGTDWEGEGVNFTLLGESQVNAPTEQLRLDDGGNEDTYILVDQQTAEGDPGNMYISIDTGSGAYNETIADGEEYDGQLTYVATGNRFAFSGQGPQGGSGGDVTNPIYPYYADGFAQNITERETISFDSPELEFDSVNDETVSLVPSQNATVSGTTNLAPGTPLTAEVRLGPPSDTLPDEDPSFLAQRDTIVEADGTFESTFDLSSRTVGEVATVRVTRTGTTIATSDAEFTDISAVQSPYFDIDLSTPATAERNETVNITGTVTNTGETAGTADVAINVDGNDAVRGIFELGAGESQQLNHSVQMEQADIEVSLESQDDSQEATVTYNDSGEAATPSTEPTPTQTLTATPTPTATPAPAEEVGGPRATQTSGENGGGFPWLLAGVGAALAIGGLVVVVLWRY